MHEPDSLVRHILIHSTVQVKWEGSRKRPLDGVTWTPAGAPIDSTTTTGTPTQGPEENRIQTSIPVQLVCLYKVCYLTRV
jgi:hypothetical protein